MFVDLWLRISPPDSDLSCILQRSAAGWRHRRVWVGATAPPALPCLWTACFSSRSHPPPSPSLPLLCGRSRVTNCSPHHPPRAGRNMQKECNTAKLQGAKCKSQISPPITLATTNPKGRSKNENMQKCRVQMQLAPVLPIALAITHMGQVKTWKMQSVKCELQIVPECYYFLQSAWLLWQNYLSKDVNICRVVFGVCTI